MSKDNAIIKLFKSITFKTDPSISDFEKCFAHINRYEHLLKNKNVGNSRYVFLGQYAYKGLIADEVFKYIGGNGKQLQQYLGNVFTNEKLSEIFDKLQMEHLISFKEGFDFKAQKYIFTAAFLGFLYENASDDYNSNFISKYFLANSKEILPKTTVINMVQILQAKAEQIINQKVKFENVQEKNGTDKVFTTRAWLSSGEIIAEHSSKSELYAKKKTMRMAIDYLLKIESENPIFKNMEARIMAEETRKNISEKKQISIKHQKYLEEKAEKRKLTIEIRQKEAKEREYDRLLNKKNLKLGEKPSKNTKEVETAKMSSKNKQRQIDKAK